MKRMATMVVLLATASVLWSEGSSEDEGEAAADTSVWARLWEFENGFTICEDQDGFVVWHQDDEIVHNYTVGGWKFSEVQERHDLEEVEVTRHEPKEYDVVCLREDE